MFFLVLFCSSFEADNAVLPSYIPALAVAYRGRDSLVQRYFDLGLNYVREIIFILILLTHGISLRLKQFKRIFRKKGLIRRQNYSGPAEKVAAAGMELQGSGSLIGYRQILQRLSADREIVRTIGSRRGRRVEEKEISLLGTKRQTEAFRFLHPWRNRRI